jgi:hypothetical protein
LADSGREEVARHLQSCAKCREALDGAADMWRRLGDVPVDAPDSRAMRARFDAMLAEQQRTQAHPASESQQPPQPHAHVSQAFASAARSARKSAGSWSRRYRGLRPLLQSAAAALLVVAGIQVGRQFSPPPAPSPDMRALRDEVRDLRQMVTLSLMQQQSASERLKGVSWSGQIDHPGNEVVAALIDTLMHDANVNVRLASIDALRRFAERDVVRSAAIQALDTQTSPLVQMALIDFVVETQERGALESLRRLSADDQVNEAVRARAVWGIDHLGAA